MSHTLYKLEVNGQTYTVSADWAQASSGVSFDGCGTQYQVADFRHSAPAAMERNISDDGADSVDVDFSEMIAYDDVDGVWVRLADDADTDHQSAEDMYFSFGWHLTTENAGDIELQAVEYENAEDDRAIADWLMEEHEGLTKDEADVIAQKAVEIRAYCDNVKALLAEAVAAYEADDVSSCVRSLDKASSVESDGGDDPASRELRGKLIETFSQDRE